MSNDEIFRGRVFSVVREDVHLPNGKQVALDIVRHPGAVVIIPMHSDGRLVLVEQYRPAVGRTLLEFPAGTLEVLEVPLDCAKREIIEEIGFEALRWQELGMLYPAPGFCDEKQFCFFAEELSPKSAPADEDECIQVVYKSPEEIIAAIREKKLVDGKSIAIFSLALFRGLIRLT